MVNSLANIVVKGKQVDMVMNGQISYTSYISEMEEQPVSLKQYVESLLIMMLLNENLSGRD